MTVKKTTAKSESRMSPRTHENGAQAAYIDSIRQRLSSVKGLEAVYAWVDGRHVVHVVSVIEEHDSDIYEFLMPQENLVEKDNPEVLFDFHVRARQKRTIDAMIPSDGILAFKK